MKSPEAPASRYRLIMLIASVSVVIIGYIAYLVKKTAAATFLAWAVTFAVCAIGFIYQAAVERG